MLDLIAHGIYDSNCYLLSDGDGNAIIIDPGMTATGAVTSELAARNLTLRAVLNTHAHFDHTAGNAAFVTGDIPLALNPADADLLAARGGASFFGLNYPQSPAPTLDLADGTALTWGAITIHVIHTPGHTPGSVCFHLPDESLLVSGDTLFRHGIGRTDLPGGSQRQIAHSLRYLLNLPGDTLVYPGHGPATTIEEERTHNPFLSMLSVNG